MAEESNRPVRLMNFVSEEQLEESKKTRGERLEDGTAQRDRPLFEVLKENKDKRDAEFNERFKHRPPKALDEDETEFLEKVELSRREYEQQVADEDAKQIRYFQAAVEAQSMSSDAIKETPRAPIVQEPKITGKRNPPMGMMIKVKAQPKKAKLGLASDATTTSPTKADSSDAVKLKTSLVSYSDESDEEED